MAMLVYLGVKDEFSSEATFFRGNMFVFVQDLGISPGTPVRTWDPWTPCQLPIPFPYKPRDSNMGVVWEWYGWLGVPRALGFLEFPLKHRFLICLNC